MKNPQVFIVIPTIRNLAFLRSWKNQFSQYNAVIIEDHPEKTIKTPKSYFNKVYHFCWKDIDTELHGNNWIFSRKNAGIRSYGFYKAYQLGADVIITFDDDCFPSGNGFIEQHINNLNFRAPEYWFPTYPDPQYMYTRGFPYQVRDRFNVVISHGLWSGALDLDAKQEILLKQHLLNEKVYPAIRQIVPKNYFFPMSSMNLAFKREIIPLMYFPPMGSDPDGKSWGFDRFDDIWAGIFAKKICDHLNLMVVNGSPFVEHRKASSIAGNFEKEKTGLEMNESFWNLVKLIKLTKNNPIECYKELAQKINFPNTYYFHKLKQAMLIWSKLFK